MTEVKERDGSLASGATGKAGLAAAGPRPLTHPGEAQHVKGDTHGAAHAAKHGSHHHYHHHHHDHHAHVDDDEHDHHGHDHSHAFTWVEAARIALVGLCVAAIFFDLPDHVYLTIEQSIFLPFSWYGMIGLLFGGWPLFKEAWESLRHRRMTMELSMSIAVIAAAYTGYFLVALWVTFFVLVAEVLEGMTLERGRRAIRELMDLLPDQVSVRRDGILLSLPASELRIGDHVLVSPGGKLPVDGVVLSGHSFVDESRITGEAMPVEKLPGGRAYAGTVNQSGALEIRAEKIGRDTSYGRILEAVEQAEKSRAPVQRLADRLAAYIVYVALGFAAFEYWITGGDINATISVIVVAGACGVAAGTPLAILGGIGRAARLGAIVKGGVHLETLGKIDTVILDKTGTLTFGKPDIAAVLPEAGVAESDLLAAAATAELRSEHPFGKAIVEHARSGGIDFEEPAGFAYTPGRGIHASTADGDIVVGNAPWLCDNGVVAKEQGGYAGSEIFVARSGRLLGRIVIEDAIRPEAIRAVEALKQMKIRTILLTGDTSEVAQAVGTRLGIETVEARMLPEEKLARVKQLIGGGSTVAMVGDGVNDAPALAAASVGVAMGSGTEVAREKADIVLLGNNLAKFAETVSVARRTRAIIWFNFAGTVIVDILGIAFAMMGWIGPFEAAAIHTGSELAFILNSARLLPGHPFRKQHQSQQSAAGLEQPAAASA